MRTLRLFIVLLPISALLTGCCYIDPESCAATPASFNIQFINNRTSYCTEEIPLKWEIYYTDNDGVVQAALPTPVPPGATGSYDVHDAGDRNQNGNIDKVDVFLNATCNYDAPIELWAQAPFIENIPDGWTAVLKLDSNDFLTVEIIPTPGASLGEKVTSAFQKLTGIGASNRSSAGDKSSAGGGAKKTAPKKKSCCW